MSYFKKFTDLCAGIGAFCAALFFIVKYMNFDPVISEDAPKKLEQFLEPTLRSDYTMLLPLILILSLSAVLGCVLRKFPFICFAFSTVPSLYVSFMFEKGVLYELIGITVIVCALHVVGNLAECAIRDKEDGKHRLSAAAKISSLMGAMLCFFVLRLSKTTAPEDTKGLTLFEKDILLDFKPLDAEIISTLFWMFAILLVISLLLYNVYFIDAILSIVPAVYAVHAMLSDNLGAAPSIFLVMAAICTVSHLMLMVFENNLSRKEQLELSKN